MANKTDEDRSIICAICLDEEDNDRSTTDVCDHPFCFSCLKEWSKIKSYCPLCKREFSLIIHDVKRDMLAYSVHCPDFLLLNYKTDLIRLMNNIHANVHSIGSITQKVCLLNNNYHSLLERTQSLRKRLDQVIKPREKLSTCIINLTGLIDDELGPLEELLTYCREMTVLRDKIMQYCDDYVQHLFEDWPNAIRRSRLSEIIVDLEGIEVSTRHCSATFVSGIDKILISQTLTYTYLSAEVDSIEMAMSR